jgi:hypothetical protein
MLLFGLEGHIFIFIVNDLFKVRALKSINFLLFRVALGFASLGYIKKVSLLSKVCAIKSCFHPILQFKAFLTYLGFNQINKYLNYVYSYNLIFPMNRVVFST